MRSQAFHTEFRWAPQRPACVIELQKRFRSMQLSCDTLNRATFLFPLQAPSLATSVEIIDVNSLTTIGLLLLLLWILLSWKLR
jgi:hypothetical protein